MKRFLILVLAISGLGGCTSEPDTVTPSLPKLSINDLSVSEKEADYEVVLDLFLSEPSEEMVILSYYTEDVTALDGKDYTGRSGQAFFEVGETRQSIKVSILHDELDEDEETFKVILSDPANAVFSDSVAIVTIQANSKPVETNELVIPTTGYTSPDTYEGMSLVWQDEFGQESLNTDDWTYEIGNGHSGWGNNELEYYTDKNTSMVEGNLVITAKKESRGGFNYTSSRIITKGKQEFKYGRVDIRAVLPFGQGIWPALWMLGANISQVSWPACGEIDIMEMVGGANRDHIVHGTLHWQTGGQHAYTGGDTHLSSGRFADEYHVFSVIWEENFVAWELDGVEFHRIDTSKADMSEFRNDFFFIFNVAVGGNWPGSPNSSTVFPQYMIVDYIRVFQTQ